MNKSIPEWFSEYSSLFNNPDRVWEHILNHGIPSDRAMGRIQEWMNKTCNQKVDRPSWTDTFMEMAYIMSKRSHDIQTQHGCVITSKDNHILSTGYNGFVGGIIDDILPNIRPEKYPWMLHSEVNAIYNCQHRPVDGIVYVTGHPCLHCYLCMANVGIKKIVYDSRPERNAVMIDEEMMTLLDIAKWLTAHKVELVPYEYQGSQ